MAATPGDGATDAKAEERKVAPAKKSIGKEKARQRSRAISLIQKHAGAYAKEGQKTKWIVDLVMKVDHDYAQDIISQKQQIASLQQQLQTLQETSSLDMQRMQQQATSLHARVQELEVEQYNMQYALHAAQAQHAVMQESLRYAEDAAAVATTECATLAAAVQAMTEQDAKARSSLAHRAHHLKEALLHTSSALRQFNDRERKERNEKEVKLRDREKALTAQRQALLDQQAAQQAKDAAMEVLQLKYHLAGLKIKELRSCQPAPDTDLGQSPDLGADNLKLQAGKSCK